MVAAKKADRIAWQVYEEGKRNVYFAAAPDFRARRLPPMIDANRLKGSGPGSDC